MCDRWLNSSKTSMPIWGRIRRPNTPSNASTTMAPTRRKIASGPIAIEQANNKSNNHLITYQGVTQTIPEWARELGMETNTLKRRILRGMTPEVAFTQEVRPIKYKSLTYDGETMTVSQWAKRIGVSGQVITHRLYQGWSVEEALTLPLSARHQQDLSYTFSDRHKVERHLDGICRTRLACSYCQLQACPYRVGGWKAGLMHAI